MKKCNIHNRIMSAIMVAVLLLTVGLSFGRVNTNAVTATNVSNSVRDVIYISTAKELEQLSRDCTLDTYSVGKYIQLNADIDLSDSSFTGIPIFSGEFDGKGHVISGLKLKGKSVNSGFFGIITEEGVVNNLDIRGVVDPDGIVESVGSLASVNEGIISNCTFEGEVINTTYLSELKASQIAGGLVGINQKGAKISHCTVNGEISGLKYTGGIAGQNFGLIVSCTNNASVNISTKDKTISLMQLRDMILSDFKNVTKILSYKKMYASENTGGITGYNTGNIISCSNNANIGTDRNGFNVGGIAGRSSGYIYDCNNIGIVRGNTNVGGITGQLEPYVRMDYSNNLLSSPKAQIDGAFDIVNTTLGDIGSDVDNVSKSITNVLDSVNKSLAICTELEDTLTDAVNVKISEVDGMVGTVNQEIEAVNQLLQVVHQVTLGLEDVSAGAVTVTSHIKDGMSKINNTSDAAGDIGNRISGIISDIVNKDSNTRNITGKVEVHKVNNASYTSADDTTATNELKKIEVYLLQNGEIYKTLKSSSVEKKTELPNTLFYGIFEFTDLPLYDSKGNKYEYNLVAFDRTNPLANWKDYTYGSSDSLKILYRSDSTKTFPLEIKWEDNNNEYGLRPSTLIIESTYNTSPSDFHVINTYQYSDSNTYNVDTGYVDVSGLSDDERKKVIFKVYPIDNYSIGAMTQDDNGTNKTIGITYTPDAKSETVEAITKDVGVILTDTFAGIGDLTKAVQSVNDVTITLKDTLNKVNQIGMPTLATFPEFSALPDTIDNDVSRLITEIQGMVTAIDGINGSLNTTQLDLTSNLQDLTGQANLITDNIFDMVATIPETLQSFLTDGSGTIHAVSYSDISTRSICGGTILNCHNQGRVIGSSVVGGVAGTIALSGIPVIDMGEKEEGSLALPQITYQVTISDCQNESSVCAINDYVGMICGKENMGSISDCKSYGRAYSIVGNYVGGVTGLSHGIINNCEVKGDIGGVYYVGGITGSGAAGNALLSGSNISNCYSSVEIEDPQQFNGAISGSDIGEFSNNYFYSENLSGINGYSVTGKYEPLGEEKLSSKYLVEKDCIVKFLDGGSVVDVRVVNPGGDLLESEFPEPVNTKFLDSFWKSKSLSNVNEDVEIYAYHRLNWKTSLFAVGAMAIIVLLMVIGNRRANRKRIKVIKKALDYINNPNSVNNKDKKKRPQKSQNKNVEDIADSNKSYSNEDNTETENISLEDKESE